MISLIINDETFLFDDEDYLLYKDKILSVRHMRKAKTLVYYESGLYHVVARVLLGIDRTKTKFIYLDGNFRNLQRSNLSLYSVEHKEQVRRSHYIQNKEQYKRKTKEWQEQNRERYKEIQRRSRTKNKEKIKTRRERYLKRPEVKERVNNLQARKQAITHYRFLRSRRRAITSGKLFTLSLEEFQFLVELPCFYCGDVVVSSGVGLDRIDNKGGYTIDNVLPCCPSCNTTRGNRHTVEETLVMINALQKYKYLCFKDEMKGLVKEE